MYTEISALREVLAQQAVSILVSAALPWAMRVAEVDLQSSINSQVYMLRHLCALIPGQGLTNLLGQGDDGACDSCADRFCTMTGKRGSVLDPCEIAIGRHARQMQQEREPCRAFYQSANRRTAQTENEIPLPVTGDRPISNLCWALADHDLGGNEGF